MVGKQHTVWVERLSWEKCIDSYDRRNTFFYVDPPYRLEGAKAYRHFFTDEDHARLADRLLATRGKWLLSYNDDEFIRRLYRRKGVKVEPLRLRYSLQGGGAWRRANELLIANY